MKHAILIAFLVALGGCSGRPATDPNAVVAPGKTPAATEAADREPRAALEPDANAALGEPGTPATADPGPAAPPTPVRGIAVGEPNPSAPRSTADARFDGYGDLRLGMAAAAARKAWGGELHGDAVESGDCGYLLPAWSKGSGEFGLMFEGAQLVRYDVGGRKETAPGGARVGMSKAQAVALYPGRVTEQPHHYVRGGQTLRIASPGGGKGVLVLETDETGKITSWRVGLAPQVDYVEGCS